MNFKGFEGWVEIFKGGNQTASNGKTYDGDALIDKAVSSFNAAEHEPPLVVGHPEDNAPAYGWVNKLKTITRDGSKILLAKFKQVVPEFKEQVEKGAYKKRSASFYPDGRLRHVGFLGAKPPAVKGLADMMFDEGEALAFDFDDGLEATFGGLLTGLREFLVSTFGIDRADTVISPLEIENINKQPSGSQAAASYSEHQGDDDMNITEKELEARVEAARQEERDKAAAEFAETQRKDAKDAEIRAIGDFCEAMAEAGKIAPSWLKLGIKEFMESLAGGEPVEFSEDTKKTPLDWFKEFLEEIPKVVEFKEIATRESDAPETDAEFAEVEDQERLDLHKKIKALAAKENISYTEAADRVTL